MKFYAIYSTVDQKFPLVVGSGMSKGQFQMRTAPPRLFANLNDAIDYLTKVVQVCNQKGCQACGANFDWGPLGGDGVLIVQGFWEDRQKGMKIVKVSVHI